MANPRTVRTRRGPILRSAGSRVPYPVRMVRYLTHRNANTAGQRQVSTGRRTIRQNADMAARHLNLLGRRRLSPAGRKESQAERSRTAGVLPGLVPRQGLFKGGMKASQPRLLSGGKAHRSKSAAPMADPPLTAYPKTPRQAILPFPNGRR